MHAQVMRLFLKQNLASDSNSAASSSSVKEPETCTDKDNKREQVHRPKFSLKHRRQSIKSPTLSTLKRMISTHVAYKTDAGIVFEQSKNDSKTPFWYDHNLQCFATRYSQAHRRGGEVKFMPLLCITLLTETS